MEPHERNRLTTLCGDECRVPIAHPFAVKGRDSTWDCATNGQALVLARGSTFPERQEAPKVMTVVPEKSKTPLRCKFSELREWCDFGPQSLSTECDECKGTGDVECDYGHDHECPECGGDGEIIPCQPAKPGRSGEIIVNRRLLWAYLAPIPDPGEFVEITAAGDEFHPVRFDGDGWIVVVMGMRADGDVDVFSPEKEKVA